MNVNQQIKVKILKSPQICFSSVQFSSVAQSCTQSCLTLCDPVNRSKWLSHNSVTKTQFSFLLSLPNVVH